MSGEEAGPEGTGLELTPDAMRAMGYAVVDRVVDRIAGLPESRTWRGATRAEMRRRLEGAGPESPAGFEALLDELAEKVFPYIGSTDHPRFFAFVPSCPTWPGLLGDFLAAGHNVFQGTWIESAGPSALELEVLDWFRGWIGYPAESAGLLLSGGSAANLTALAAARDARLGGHPDDAVIYLSAETHSSVERAARILGFDPRRIRKLPVDRGYRLDPDVLAREVARDRDRGLRPFLVVANGGATSTGAVDPLEGVAEVCRAGRLWLHVDAAYGGFAVLTEEGARLLRGLDRADSVTLDPHKWLFQPYEAGCLMVRDGRALVDAFHIMPDYLQDTALGTPAAPDDAEVNFADRGPQLTRSFRALKIWLSLRYYGLDRIRAAIARGMELAVRAEAWIEASPTFRVLSPATLGVVCFRSDDGEPADAERVRRLAESGVGMISSTRVGGEYALRLCILNHRSGWRDVEAVLEHLERPV
jgi:aromatic-L-amino-acid decarboxylase